MTSVSWLKRSSVGGWTSSRNWSARRRSGRDARRTRSEHRVGERGVMTTQALHHPSRPLHRVLSRRLVVAAELLFTAGVSIGWVRYEHRSTTPLHHVPGSNAWWQHAAIA